MPRKSDTIAINNPKLDKRVKLTDEDRKILYLSMSSTRLVRDSWLTNTVLAEELFNSHLIQRKEKSARTT